MQEFLTNYPLPSLLKASWQAAVLILLVLAAQWAFGRRLSPRWRYGLWLLVVARLALPWTIPSPISVFNLLSYSKASAAVASLRVNPEPPGSIAPASRSSPGGTAPGHGSGNVRGRNAGVRPEPVAPAAGLGGRGFRAGGLPGDHPLPALAKSHAAPSVD